MHIPESYTTGLPGVWGKCDPPVPKLVPTEVTVN